MLYWLFSIAMIKYYHQKQLEEEYFFWLLFQRAGSPWWWGRHGNRDRRLRDNISTVTGNTGVNWKWGKAVNSGSLSPRTGSPQAKLSLLKLPHPQTAPPTGELCSNPWAYRVFISPLNHKCREFTVCSFWSRKWKPRAVVCGCVPAKTWP